jgi:hypothetical protein
MEETVWQLMLVDLVKKFHDPDVPYRFTSPVAGHTLSQMNPVLIISRCFIKIKN